MNEREKLQKELDKCLVYVPGNGSRHDDEKLIDFILQDRKRIVEPLIKAKGLPAFCRAIDKTLANANVDEA